MWCRKRIEEWVILRSVIAIWMILLAASYYKLRLCYFFKIYLKLLFSGECWLNCMAILIRLDEIKDNKPWSRKYHWLSIINIHHWSEDSWGGIMGIKFNKMDVRKLAFSLALILFSTITFLAAWLMVKSVFNLLWLKALFKRRCLTVENIWRLQSE